MVRLLSDIAYVRSGDKGDICTIGVIAKSPDLYPTVLASVTADRVKALFGDFVKGKVSVYRMDNIEAVSVVMEQALGGGATRTLRLDQTGKSMGNAILRLPVISNR
jgi:putative Ca2+/H+ antiporter (TMEM165/GDT1 family)